jgi:hypothetical protein
MVRYASLIGNINGALRFANAPYNSDFIYLTLAEVDR